jgi:signal transduction histidine kinase
MSAATLAAVLHPEAPRRSRRGTAGEPGTGLGLRVSLAFARELGATLTAESQPGQGTTFGLTLPVG